MNLVCVTEYDKKCYLLKLTVDGFNSTQDESLAGRNYLFIYFNVEEI